MHLNEELSLLIKSKYPVIYFETVDETHSIEQVKSESANLGYDYYVWTVTEGLRRGSNANTYYKTNEPAKMLITAMELLKPAGSSFQPPSVFVLVDFEKYLDDPGILRFFKDAVLKAKETSSTFVIVASQYKMPQDLEAYSSHLTGGYPREKEIRDIILETVMERSRIGGTAVSRLTEEETNKMISALKGLSVQQVRNVINQCLVDDGILSGKDLNLIEQQKKRIFDREGMLEFYITEGGNSIAGFSNLKRYLQDRKGSYNITKSSVLPPPKGVLLLGVQGCGKSLAAKVIAGELSLPLYRLDMGRLYSKYVGETEENLRKVLVTVEKLSPLCLWIDEIEKGFAGSGASGGTGDNLGIAQRVLGTFLTWMQEKKSPCFIAATANDIKSLPPEFLRKGRFDEVFFVDLPNGEERIKIFEILLKKRDFDSSKFDLRELAIKTEGFSGAEIEQAIISALYRCSSQSAELDTESIMEQIQSTKPLSVVRAEEVGALRQWAAERTVPV